MLTQSELKKQLSYDAETGEFAWAISKQKVRAGAIAGKRKPSGYIEIKINLVSYQAHRLAWLYMHAEWPPFQIDHRNGIRSDNRIVNLRLATRAENARNAPAGKNSSTGLKGISPAGKKFRAQMKIGDRKLHLGYFLTKEEAAKAYSDAAQKLHGEFAFSPSLDRT